MKNIALLVLSFAGVFFFAGCAEPGETTGIGAATGGAIGAGLGAIVGNQTGSTGGGMVIGAVAGASAGALVGNALDAQQQAIRTQDEAIERQEKLITAQTAELNTLRAMQGESDSNTATQKGVNQNHRIVGLADSLPDRYIPPTEVAQTRNSHSNKNVAFKENTASRQVALLPVERAVKQSEKTAVSPALLPVTKETQAEAKSYKKKELIAEKDLTVTDLHSEAETEVVVGSENQAMNGFDKPAGVPENDLKARFSETSSLDNNQEPSDCKGAQLEFSKSERAYDTSQRMFHVRRALRLCPDNALYHNALGELYVKLQRSDDAQFEFKEALKVQPDFKPAKENLARLSTRE